MNPRSPGPVLYSPRCVASSSQVCEVKDKVLGCSNSNPGFRPGVRGLASLRLGAVSGEDVFSRVREQLILEHFRVTWEHELLNPQPYIEGCPVW